MLVTETTTPPEAALEADDSATSGDGTAEKKLSYEAYRKVLKDRKETQEKLQEALSKLKEKEEKELEDKGNLQAIVTNLRKEIHDAKEALKGERIASTWEKISSKVKEQALLSGYDDPENFINEIPKEDLKTVQIDEVSKKVDEDAIKAILEKSKAKWPKRFQGPTPKIVNPPIRATNDLHSGDIKKMSLDELWDKFKKTKHGG
jgi:hypothetical protein